MVLTVIELAAAEVELNAPVEVKLTLATLAVIPLVPLMVKAPLLVPIVVYYKLVKPLTYKF